MAKKSRKRKQARKKSRGKPARARKTRKIKSAKPRKQSRARKPAPRKSARKETPRERKLRIALTLAQRNIRGQRDIIKELTRGKQYRIPRDDGGESAPDQPTMPRESGDVPFQVPKGAEITGYDDDGEPNAFEMPDFVEGADDYDSPDWYDFIDDEYGDYDDTDPYGDEA